MTPSRTAQPSTASTSARQALGRRLDVASIPAAAERRARPGELDRERRLAIPADGLAHGRQRLAGDPLHVRDLGGRALRVVGEDAARRARS